MSLAAETALAVAQSVMFNAMRASGLTQSEVARRMGTSRSCVTRMFKGDHHLNLKTLARFLEATGHKLTIGAALLAAAEAGSTTRCRGRGTGGRRKVSQYDEHNKREDFDVSRITNASDWWNRHGPRIRVELNEHIPYSTSPIRLNIGVLAAKKLIAKLQAVVREIEAPPVPAAEAGAGEREGAK